MFHAVSELQAAIEAQGVAKQPPAPASADSVVGEVVDTHHPHRPGRICVRWRDATGAEHVHWLPYNTGLRFNIGQRVVIARPSNWPEWLVTASLSQAWEQGPIQENPEDEDSSVTTIRLEESETLRVQNARGETMFELGRQGGQPVLKVSRDLNLELDGTFRVDAARVEIRSGQNGTDIRSEGDTVVRSRQVRIN